MKRRLPYRTLVGGVAVLAVLLYGVLPSALTVRAAGSTPPRIQLKVNGGNPAITVVDRDHFLVDGSGFQSGEPVKLQATFPAYSGNNIVENRTVTADGNGNFSNVTMYAPPGAKAGWSTLTATGQTSNKTAQGRVWVAYQPYIFLNRSSVTPGSWVAVSGRGFVASSPVKVELTIQSDGGNSQTITVSTTADNNGNFTKWTRIPNYTSAGSYTVTATDTTAGFKRYAKLNVTRQAAPNPAPKATATPTATPSPTAKPSSHALASVVPSVTLPNQDVTFTGSGFPTNASVTVSLTVSMRGGGNRYISANATTDSNGTFTTAFRVPYKTAPGTYTVTASGSGAQASDQLQVLPLSAHPSFLNFSWVSLWYHTVRQGTWDYVTVQSTLKTQLGIWVHVIFPSGLHADFYTETDHNGRWSVKFTIPKRGISKHSNQAYITFQLWHGKQTTQQFMDFTLV